MSNNTEAYLAEVRRENLRAVRRGHALTVRELMNDTSAKGDERRKNAGVEVEYKLKHTPQPGLVSLASLLDNMPNVR